MNVDINFNQAEFIAEVLVTEAPAVALPFRKASLVVNSVDIYGVSKRVFAATNCDRVDSGLPLFLLSCRELYNVEKRDGDKFTLTVSVTDANGVVHCSDTQGDFLPC